MSRSHPRTLWRDGLILCALIISAAGCPSSPPPAVTPSGGRPKPPLAASKRIIIPTNGNSPFWDAVREGVKLTVVVFAEGSWSMEVPNEQLLYGRTFGTEMGTVRWDVVAQGLGCDAAYATTLAEVDAALAKARAASGPALVCVATDRAANMGVPPEAAVRFMEVYQGPM